MDADLVLIAMGFLGPVRNGMIEQLGVQLDNRGNVATDQNYMSSVPGVFAAGDMRRGQSESAGGPPCRSFGFHRTTNSLLIMAIPTQSKLGWSGAKTQRSKMTAPAS